MRNFSWKYFTLTGDVDAFLLYKKMDRLGSAEEADPGEEDFDDSGEDGVQTL